MSRPFVCLIVLALCAATNVSECEAQIRQRLRDRRAALLTPPADAAVAAQPAQPGTEPAATPPAIPPVRGGFLARRLQQRRDLVAQQAAQAQPTPASPTPPQPRMAQQAQRPPQRQPVQALRQVSALAAPAMRALSPADMTKMDVPTLQSALSDTNGSLSNELNHFTSAASWQKFFNLPEGIVDEGTIDLASLQTALVRFENVAANPKFAQIAALPSFQQSRSLLTELVNRADLPLRDVSHDIDGPQLLDPASAHGLSTESAESLPAPQSQLPRNNGEHSILVKKNS